jgi:hypothetical protein
MDLIPGDLQLGNHQPVGHAMIVSVPALNFPIV